MNAPLGYSWSFIELCLTLWTVICHSATKGQKHEYVVKIEHNRRNESAYFQNVISNINKKLVLLNRFRHPRIGSNGNTKYIYIEL